MELRPALHELATEPASITARRLWQAMTAHERTLGLQAVLEEPKTKWRSYVVDWLADVRKFRRRTVGTWPIEKLAKVGAGYPPRDATLITEVFTQLHMRERTPILVAFLDRLGVKHTQGVIDDEPMPVLAASDVKNAADELIARFLPDDVVLYFLCLLQGSTRTTFGALEGWLTERFGAVPMAAPSDAPVVIEEPAPVSVPQLVDGFTTLDRHMVLSVVDAVGQVDGALSEDELDDMIDELLHLNGRRHQSYFHAGFRDVLLNRDLMASLPANNESRRRWYWAGCVSGLARADRWSDIVALYDREPTIRSLGDAHSVKGPTEVAAWLVFRALCGEERYSEATGFLTPAAVAVSVDLQRALLRVATDLIRRNRASDARGMLQLAWANCQAQRRVERPMDARYCQMVKRRWALCLRQLGELEEARTLLGELANEPDPIIRAIALTDIGLIKAGIGRLGQLVIPHEPADQRTFAEALGRGESEFTAALSTRHFTSRHASFAYGVLLLARENYGEAIHHLGAALTFFQASPDVYELDGTLGLAHLYLGLAICNTLEDPGRLPRACELLHTGLERGAVVPRGLVARTIGALALVRNDLAVQAAEDILAAAGPAALDRILDSTEGLTSTAITGTLFRRAADPSRPTSVRAADYRRAIPMLLRQGDIERARDGLEFLEEAAVDGIGRVEFLQLLDDPDRCDPVWKRDRVIDARIYLLEAEGRLDEAALLLKTECYRLLARDEDHALDQALLALAQLEHYGPCACEIVSRLSPILQEREAKREARESAETHVDETPVRILVVGGNEVQARMDDDIAARLKAEHPYIDVTFMHTGWSGNWSGYADEFSRRVRSSDGVVFLSFMRTMLGRTMRDRCTLPWRGCARGGQGAIIQTILRVAPAAQARVRSRIGVMQRA